MTRTFALATSFAALLAGTAAYAEMVAVKSVTVQSDLTAIENPAAAAYWTTVSDDLKTAIVSRLTNMVPEDTELGTTIDIDLNEFELSNGFTETLGLADTKLVGKVMMVSTEPTGLSGSYDLAVDINQAMPMLPAGVDVTTLPADTRVYYDAMIAAFAQAVVSKLN